MLLMNYVLKWLGVADLPLPVTVAMTTIVTVPIIEFLVVPAAKDIIAKAETKANIEGALRDD